MNCCEKCRCKFDMEGDRLCHNLDCQCHIQAVEQGWEKKYYELTDVMDGLDRPRLKTFIQDLLRKEREGFAEKVEAEMVKYANKGHFEPNLAIALALKDLLTTLKESNHT